MKTSINKTILVLCMGIMSLSVFGQELRNAYQKAVDNIFSGIPSEKVTTGILIERAPSIVNMFLYEGAHKEIIDTCNVRKWKQMILQLNIAHLDSRKFNYDSHIVETDYKEKSKTGDIPLGIIFYDYNRIDPEALNKGLLSIDTVKGSVRDISEKNKTPLTTVTCFAASPMVEIIQTGTYSFNLEPSIFITNKTQSFDEIAIDIGDGKGFITFPADGRVNVNFDTSGIHIITIKAVQKDKNYLSYSAIFVQETNISLRAGTPDPERTPNVYCYNFITGNGANAINAECGIWYRCNHNNTVRKPLLIVSGFDPSDKNRIWEDTNDNRYLYHVANKDRFRNRLRENGYDIIIYRSIITVLNKCG